MEAVMEVAMATAAAAAVEDSDLAAEAAAAVAVEDSDLAAAEAADSAAMAVEDSAAMAVDLEAAAAVEPPRECKPARDPCRCRSRSIQQRHVLRHLKLRRRHRRCHQ